LNQFLFAYTQCIERIEGLSVCAKLQKLWLLENRISKIEGLEACTGLQELYLYSNRISSITGLDHLTGLKVGSNSWAARNGCPVA
jgi:Leucine-rich repeat (LRR) protein